MTSEPSSKHSKFIIQIGMLHVPSYAMNSKLPQYVFKPISAFYIMNVIG
jgi:hypothetical protein